MTNSEQDYKATCVVCDKDVRYYCHHLNVPADTVSRISFLRKYYEKLLSFDPELPENDKLRDSEVEWADDAIYTFNLICSKIESGKKIIGGSVVLSAVPWATFGTFSLQTDGMLNYQTKNKFTSVLQIIDYYRHKQYFHPLSQVKIYHVIDSKREDLKEYVETKICKKYRITPSIAMTVLVGLLYDIIVNCGPDSDFFYVYTNNCLDTQNGNEVYNQWRILRKLMPTTNVIPQLPVYYPIVDERLKEKEKDAWNAFSDVVIEDYSQSNDLWAGESQVMYHHQLLTGYNSFKYNQNQSYEYTEQCETWLGLNGMSVPKRHTNEWKVAFELFWEAEGEKRWEQEVKELNLDPKKSVFDLQRKIKRQKNRKEKRLKLKNANKPQEVIDIENRGIVRCCDLAEDWAANVGLPVPSRTSLEWPVMYKNWWNQFLLQEV